MAEHIDTVLEIDTPEHLAFRTRIAGPGRRMLAWLVDLALRSAVFFVLAIGVSIVFGSAGLEGFGTGLVLLVVFALDWGYFFVAELATGGRSPGKIAMKLRAVRTNGLPITWRESFLRNLLRAADIAILPPYVLVLGPMVMALDRKFRRLGDLVAGTIVIVEEPALMAHRPSVVASDALVAELPGVLPLDRHDLEALELFVNREHMSDARREELAEIVAPIYAHRLNVPRPRNGAVFLASLWARAQDPRRRMAP